MLTKFEDKTLFIPIAYDTNYIVTSNLQEEHVLWVSDWMNTKLDFIRESWKKFTLLSTKNPSFEATATVISKILAHKTFNFQSKNKITNILVSVEQNIKQQLQAETPLNFFLLYNGGYRASSSEKESVLIFEPDQTEMMLLYQIALLKSKIEAIYPKGIEFTIVINDGVAKWVNDIAIANTQNYANKLREMITFFGAENCVKVLVQSELANFNPNFSFELKEEQTVLSEEDYLMVERFLGRSCNKEEAMHRAALYKLAELKWAEHLLPIVTNENALLLRQVAHPDMLSFRPFPGGAIRIQNGTFGFQYQNNTLQPKLITSKTVLDNNVKWIRYAISWEINTIAQSVE